MINFWGRGTITKKIATSIAKLNFNRFKKEVDQNLSKLIKSVNSKNVSEIEIVSFSSSEDYHQQVFSILSFLRYVGIPIKWTIYSDGTHTKEQISNFKNEFQFIDVFKFEFKKINILNLIRKDQLKPCSDYFLDFANKHPLGKKLFYFLNHEIKCPTLFIDSDILFYKKSCTFFNKYVNRKDINGWYLADIGFGCLDSRYLNETVNEADQINSGAIFMPHEIKNYSAVLEIFKKLNHTYEYFSEQTIFHILLKNNTYIPFSTTEFIVDTSDQFNFGYNYKPHKIALRHFTGPVRHKMWQRSYKWHLSI